MDYLICGRNEIREQIKRKLLAAEAGSNSETTIDMPSSGFQEIQASEMLENEYDEQLNEQDPGKERAQW